MDALGHTLDTCVEVNVNCEVDWHKKAVAGEGEHLGRQQVQHATQLWVDTQPRDDFAADGRLEDAPARTDRALSACLAMRRAGLRLDGEALTSHGRRHPRGPPRPCVRRTIVCCIQ